MKDRFNPFVSALALMVFLDLLLPVYFILTFQQQWDWFFSPTAMKNAPFLLYGNLLVLALLLLIPLFLYAEKQIRMLQELYLKFFPEKFTRMPNTLWLLLVPGLRTFLLPAVYLILAWRRKKLPDAPPVPFLMTLAAGTSALGLILDGVIFFCFPGSIIFTLPYFPLYAKYSDWIALGYLLYFILIVILSRTLTGIAFSRTAKAMGVTVGVIFLIYLTTAFLTIRNVEKREAKLIAELRSVKAPVTRADSKALYYRGTEPDKDFTAWVDAQTQALKNGKTPPEKLGEDFFGRKPYEWSEKRNALSKALREPSIRKYIDETDSLARKNKLLRYPRKYDEMLCGILLPEQSCLRTAAQIYCLRIVDAVNRNDRAEAMRLLRLSMDFQNNTQKYPDWIISMLVEIASEALHLEAVEYMLGSGILTDADLDRLAEMYRGREKHFFESADSAFRGESALTLDVWVTLLQRGTPYSSKQLIYENRIQRYANFLVYYILMNDGLIMGNNWLELIRIIQTGRDYYQIQKELDNPRFEINKGNMPPFAWLTGMLFPAIAGSYKKTNGIAAQLRMCLLALEIEKYKRAHGGRPPESLSELNLEKMPVDPFTGKPFFYQHGKIKQDVPLRSGNNSPEAVIEQEGYRLYSVGYDGMNDKGDPRRDTVFSVVKPSAATEKKTP
ncbi:MAG: hypothetical protein BWY31_01415 [Lentisphaerae bacterium ADurb.Bin242]|nr:MAG: hypothetical protein BWY31_01415 [Lentisphaerae bacterium ADurb.Bin242]